MEPEKLASLRQQRDQLASELQAIARGEASASLDKFIEMKSRLAVLNGFLRLHDAARDERK
jgi:hypothetical protein